MTISENSWDAYIGRLRMVSDEAAKKFTEYFVRVAHPLSEAGRKALTWQAFVIGRDYGEAAAELACEMYDSMIAAEGMAMGRPVGWIEPAVPARTATYSEAAKTVNGVLNVSVNPNEIAGAVSRLVKLASVDTIQQNAIRDGAQWAWIPRGDTCAFCLTLASNGWQRASKKAIKNGHAEHVHSHCDCTYAVRFSEDTDVEGYNPDKYRRIYYGADGNTPKQKINAMRRDLYQENREEIREQQNAAYAARKEKETGE